MSGIIGGRGAATAIIVVTAWVVSACGGLAPPRDPGPGAPAAVEESVSTSPSAVPVVEKKTVTETVEIPFERTTRDDPNLASGKQVVATKGVPGTKTLTYEVTFVDGSQTDKKLVSETVTKAPVTELTRVGTKKASNCDPNYSGACVPVASDVDCEGGGGNGPAYVRGPVYVVGRDIYGLDADHDGIGCE